MKDGKNEPLHEDSACQRFEENLAGYLEGHESLAALAHAKECDFCGCVLADLELIRSVSLDIETEEPPARIWTNVRATLVQEGVIRDRAGFWKRWVSGTRRGFLPYPAPLAAAAAVAITAVILFKAPGYLNHSVAPPANVIHAAVFSQNYTAAQDISNLQEAIQQLESAYDANASSLEPSMKATYQKGLDSLDDEIRECQASMKQQPEDGLTRQYLSTAYVQKAELLQSALESNLR